MFIKFSIIFIVLHFTLVAIFKLYIDSLDPLDTLRVGMKNFTKRETIWIMIIGATRIGVILLIPINIILLVLKYL